MNNNKIKCPYCGLIGEESVEHVIPDALGGALKSKSVCCKSCNNQLGKLIDAKFIEMFASIRGKILSLNGNHGRSVAYPVLIRDAKDPDQLHFGSVKGDAISCDSLASKLKQSPKALNLTKQNIEAYVFNWDNRAFRNGICKIAVGYALESGINYDNLKHGIVSAIANNKLSNIDYNFPIVPFVPMTEFDRFVELETSSELYHYIKLFNHGQRLWCYVDLFNTFQFYVLLSDEFKCSSVAAEYCQFVISRNHSVPKLSMNRSPKDAMIDAMQYGVEPTLDDAELNRRILIAVQNASVPTSIDAILREKLSALNMSVAMANMTRDNLKLECLMRAVAGINDYFSDDDELNHSTYRQIFSDSENGIISYPDACGHEYGKNKDAVCQYTNAKFAKMWELIVCNK